MIKIFIKITVYLTQFTNTYSIQILLEIRHAKRWNQILKSSLQMIK